MHRRWRPRRAGAQRPGDGSGGEAPQPGGYRRTLTWQARRIAARDRARVEHGRWRPALPGQRAGAEAPASTRSTRPGLAFRAPPTTASAAAPATARRGPGPRGRCGPIRGSRDRRSSASIAPLGRARNFFAAAGNPTPAGSKLTPAVLKPSRPPGRRGTPGPPSSGRPGGGRPTAACSACVERHSQRMWTALKQHRVDQEQHGDQRGRPFHPHPPVEPAGPQTTGNDREATTGADRSAPTRCAGSRAATRRWRRRGAALRRRAGRRGHRPRRAPPRGTARR